MFKINVDERLKRVNIFAKGFFTEEEALSFLEEYDKKTRILLANNYSLVIDTRELQTSKPEVANILNQVMLKYVSTPFENIYAYKLKQILPQMQIERLGKSIPGFERIKFISSNLEISL